MPGEATAYVKVEKPRFLFLEGSTDAVVAVGITTTALSDASVARAVSSTDRPARLLVRGAQAPTSQGGPAPRRSLPLLPLPTTSTPRSSGEKVPAARAAGTPHPAVPGAPAAGSSAPSCAPPALAPAAMPRACALGLGAWAGRTARRPRPPSARKSEMSELHRRVARE
jgi:hypothetical protein